MYRTPTHDSRNKQETRDRALKSRAGKHEEQKEYSDGFSTEDDDESTDRYTEDSEDTTESLYEKGKQGESSVEDSQMAREKAFAKFGQHDDFLMRAYYANEKYKKHDKNTQKNFLSPFPSFLIPPIYRDLARPPNVRYASPRPTRENQNYVDSYDRSLRGSPKDTYEKKLRSSNREHRDKKLCEKYRNKKEIRNFSSKTNGPERVLTCLQGESSIEPPSVFTKSPVSPENEIMIMDQRQKSSSQENRFSQIMNFRKSCSQSKENQKKGKPFQIRSSQMLDIVEEHIQNGKNVDEGLETVPSGKVKEKLMYVVEEEEGKKVTKLETDLFSLNEILAIKKDLLELSEFAKKLKKLKEMKKDVEKEKSDKSCQCKPVGELLKNVNKKIEALEARQEELEMGSFKSDQKLDSESIKTVDPSTFPNSIPKALPTKEGNGVPATLSFPKTEILLSKVGFSNNFEIANELIDIKNQLQKLEKRRMSEITPETGLSNESKLGNKKEHGIAVFSSKTYILTSENYKKKLKSDQIKEEVTNCLSVVEKPIRKTDQIQENVANWLKNVSPVEGRSEKEIPVFMNVEELSRTGTFGDNTLMETHLANSGDFLRVVKDDSTEIKEPQKNRAQAEPKNKSRLSLEVLMKNNKMNKSTNGNKSSQLNFKECILTTSGKLYFLNSEDDLSVEKPMEGKIATKLLPQKKELAKEIGEKTSCDNQKKNKIDKNKIDKNKIDKNKIDKNKIRTVKEAAQDISHLESAQEHSAVSSDRKDQKTVRNINVKKLVAPLIKEKICKENKNAVVKKQKNSSKGDDFRSTSTFSQLLGTVDLDTVKPVGSSEKKERENHNMHVYSLGGMPKFNFKSLESKGSENYFLIHKNPKRRAPEAVKEVMKPQSTREPDCEVEEPSTSQPTKCKEPKPHKRRHCDCDYCCIKRLKKQPSEDRVSIVQTASSLTSNCSRESRNCRRARRRREYNEEKMLRREARELLKLERRKERQRKTECREAEKRLRQRVRSEGIKCKEDVMKKGCIEKSRLKRFEDCLKLRRRSRERCRKRKSKESCRPKKKRKSCRHGSSGSKILCKCEDRQRSFCGHPECRLEKICIRVIEPPPCPKEPPPCPKEPPPCPKEPPSCLKEQPAQVVCSETRSDDTVELYSRRECLKPSIVKNKLADDSCKFGSFLKSIRRLYPKFSHLQFGNFSGDVNDRKYLHQQVKQKVECLKNHKYNGDDCESIDSERPLYRQSSVSFKDRTDICHYPNHHGGSHHLKTCKCIRVYCQSQQRQEWPGVMPFQSLSVKDPEEITCTGSTEDSKAIKHDFIFPGKLPDYQCVAYSCEEKCEKPCKRSCKKCKPRRQRREKCRKPRRRRRSRCCDDDLCKCFKCGNVHEKDLQKCCNEEPVTNCKPVQSIHSPVFSFLKYFCKSKKSGGNILNKISEVRHLRTCAGVKTNKKEKMYSCICVPNIPQDNICRPKEKPPSECVKVCCCKREKKQKRRKKVKCCECTNSENLGSCDRRRKRKKKRRIECCESVSIPRTEFYTCPVLLCNNLTKNNDIKEFSEFTCTNSTNDTNIISYGSNNTSESATTKTTTTTASSPTTVEEGKSLSILKLEKDLRKKDWKLKEKLSSIQFLLKNLEKFKKAKCQTQSNNLVGSAQPDLIDGFTKCNTKMDSSSFMKIIKKLKGNKTDKKNKTKEKFT